MPKVKGETRVERKRRKAGTEFWDGLGPWYSLDNAASIMPSTSDATTTNLFRFSVTFREDIDRTSLRQALDATVARFPYFGVTLRRGLFWHYLEPLDHPLPIGEDDPLAPLIDYDVNAKGHAALRVRVGGRLLACEFSHVITDGTGAMRFLKNLTVEYLKVRGRAPGEGLEALADGDPEIVDLGGTFDPAENEDAYQRNFDPSLPSPEILPRAFNPAYLPLTPHTYRIICGIIPVAALRDKAKAYGVSVTELLAAAYMDTLQEIWLASPRSRRRRHRLVVNIPVNLRKFFPTPSNRNFSLVASVDQDMRLGRRDFDDIVARTHHQLRVEHDARAMGRQIARNVGASTSLVFRIVPLPVKDLLFKLMFLFYGSSIYSGSISNLGQIRLPAWAAAQVERMDFLPSPYVDKANIGVLSFGDSLYLNFGSLNLYREIERLFFCRLRRLGLPVRVECNI